MKRGVVLASLLGILVLGGRAHAQSDFVNFESSLVKPILVHEGRLLALHPEEGRLVVRDLGSLALVDEIPVGLEPVSVRARPGHPDEVWVVNSLSDDVSVVDLSLGRVVAIIPVGDEPADVAFSRQGRKAYVTIGEEDRVAVIDADLRLVVGSVDVPFVSPRTIEAVAGGRFVVVSSFKSGNETTVIPFDHPQAPPSSPQVGVIIPDDDPRSSVDLEDKDVVAIRTSTDQLLPRSLTGLGTILFSHGIHPGNGKLYVTNTEALNLVQFEPEVRGHIVDNRLSIVGKSAGTVTRSIVDLNPHVDYDVLPDAQAVPLSLAQPTDLAFHPGTGRIYVAAFGSAKVGVLDEDGNVLGRIAVGEGPRGLALDAGAERLYSYNWISGTISEIDIQTEAVVASFPIGGFDPTPEVIRQGRTFLYDAQLSGNGTSSCASCHIDGDTDFLAWDLGDPAGMTVPGPEPGILFAPKKGPMTTQTLRGLKDTGALHWRGDRPTFEDFNGAFVSLMGRGQELPAEDMGKFADFVETIRFAPNPHLNPDRSLSDQARRGFNNFKSTLPFGGVLSCMQCHNLPFGTTGPIIPRSLLNPISQDFKAGKLRATYHKEGRFEKAGFGVSHDGAIEDLFGFFSFSPPFPPFAATLKRDFARFVFEFDTGTAPSVGTQILVDETNAGDGATLAAILALISDEAGRVHCDVIVHGDFQGERHGFFFNTQSGKFLADATALGRFTPAELLAEAAAGRATFVVKGVAVGSGARLSIDRDSDCLPDLDEPVLGTSAVNADTDDDGWLDGWEVFEGSDPTSAASVPTSLTAPVIHGVPELPNARPYGAERSRLRVTASGVLPGATLLATIPSGNRTTEYAIFPTGPGEWTTHADFAKDDLTGNARGWTFVIRNKTGASSPPFQAP